MDQHKIANKITHVEDFHIFQEFRFDSIRQNELLMFIKPEVFLVEDQLKVARALEMVFKKLHEYEVDINGIVSYSGEYLKELQAMDAHYGYINSLSKTASDLISSELYEKIKIDLHLAKDLPVYGGHELLNRYSNLTPASLDELWFTKQSKKIRSGMYCQTYTYADESFILINGFHPQQLAHYTNDKRHILILLLSSDTPWSLLRNNMVGATFPEKAVSESIRSLFFENASDYGLKDVSIANNCVHLSAGPIEALFEMKNFLKKTTQIKYDTSKSNIARIINRDDSINITTEKLLQNEYVTLSGNRISFYDLTEDMDTFSALKFLSMKSG